MFDFLKSKLIPENKSDIQSRLSKSEAINIACEAEIAVAHKEFMTITILLMRDEKPTWIVSLATAGRMIEVVIDDETGNVIETRRVGKR